MNELLSQRKKMVIYFLFFLGIITSVFYSASLDTAGQINPTTQSQVVMQGHSSLQIFDTWYEIG